MSEFNISFILLLLIGNIALGKVVPKEELCSYDPDFCESIYKSDGQVIPVKAKIRALLSELDDEIVSISQKYGVDPRAVAGAIAAENTLNVQIDDDIQNFLAKAGIRSIMGKSFSYGLGQIRPEVAMGVESLAAKIEGRPRRNSNEVETALLDPEESLKYAAAIIRDAQDKYAQAGTDISNNPAALATLYNTGGVEKKVANRKPGDEVRPNFFGVFVAANMNTLQDAIGWSPEKGKYQPMYQIGGNQSLEKNFFRNPQNLFTSPHHCSTEGADKLGEINAVVSRINYKPVARQRGRFKILRTDLDCDMKRWNLIQFENGQLGWIPNEIIKNQGRISKPTQLKTKNNCSRRKKACKEEIKKFGFKVINQDPLQVEAQSFRKDEPADIKNFNRWCLHNHRNSRSGNRTRNGVMSPWGSVTYRNNESKGDKEKLTMLLGRRLKKDIEELKKSIETKTGKKWDDISGFERRLVERLEEQLSQYYPKNYSQLMSHHIERRVFNRTNYNKIKDYFVDGEVTLMEFANAGGIRLVEHQYGEPSRGSPFKYNDYTYNAVTKGQIIDGLRESCKGYLDDFKIDNLVQYMEAFKMNRSDVIGFHEIRTRIVNICLIGEYGQGKNDGSFCDPECEIKINSDHGSNPVKFKKSELQNAKLSKTQIKSILNDTMGDNTTIGGIAAGNYSRGGGQDNSCNFDEVSTFESLEKTVNLECVQKVMVPNRQFFNSIYVKGGHLSKKVIFDNVDSDNLTISVKDCPTLIETHLPEETNEEEDSADTNQ